MNIKPEYKVWKAMKQRCYNPNNQRFAHYGGRGIQVCERWINSFENFLLDMGNRPSPEHSIDRIDNNQDYNPSNCRWATDTEQNRNRSVNTQLTFNGKTMCVSEWVEETGIPETTIYSRLSHGWSVEKTLGLPSGAYSHHSRLSWRVMTPDNEILDIDNLKEFASERNLLYKNLHATYRGIQSTHKGYKVLEKL